MFYYATFFNGDLSIWNMDKVTNMSYMFEGVSSFNQELCWNVTGGTNMDDMFTGSNETLDTNC